jgi:predicted sulfurtransferase
MSWFWAFFTVLQTLTNLTKLHNMNILITKTKAMAFQRNNIRMVKTVIKGEINEEVKDPMYLQNLIINRIIFTRL